MIMTFFLLFVTIGYVIQFIFSKSIKEGMTKISRFVFMNIFNCYGTGHFGVFTVKVAIPVVVSEH